MINIGLDTQLPQKNKEEHMILFACHKIHEDAILRCFKETLKPSVKTRRSIIMSNPKLLTPNI